MPASDRSCPPGRGIPFGLDSKDKPTHVTQVKPGHTYRCPSCKWPLSAVLNTTGRRQHFRHRKGAECSNAYEASLHKAAEQIIEESSEILLPAVVARHGHRSWSITDKPGKFQYDGARLEVQMDGIVPDVVLREASVAKSSASAARELLVEIFVTHRTEQRKIDLIRERRLPTIEINLSKTPRFVTADEFKQSVLYGPKRKWLFNNAIHNAEAALREEAEKSFGGIGASLNDAYEVDFIPVQNRWEQDIKDARVEDLVGTHVPGDRCFTVAPGIWQSAILSRFLRSPDRSRFDAEATLDWLDHEGLLKPVFRRLLGEIDRDLLAHVRAVVPGFRHPLKVVEDYAGQMVLYGLVPRSKSTSGSSHSEPTELAEERARRIREMYYWRLRVAEVEEVFKAIQAEAKNGPIMNWEFWLDTFQVTLSGTPRSRISGREVGFRELMNYLEALRQMLKPNTEVPTAGLLGLPLEPERDAREAERRGREAAERARVAAEIERRRQAAEQARLDREAEQRARGEAEESRVAAEREAAAVPKPRHRVGRKRTLRERVAQVRDRLSEAIRFLNPWS
ncbi:hypothetical protein JMJ56_23130 [Belnapia sp. T18]|uniref:Competence protein CoiA-like family protein n=2 Tax=Belnapia arida TaxID=2804533 RepID=A0ABS1U8A1_9PROT|nr:hypothetical protein [Belnapia arida]